MQVERQDVALVRGNTDVRPTLRSPRARDPRREAELLVLAKLAAVFVLCYLCFAFSLNSLIAALRYDSPLAYVGLVPIVCIVLAGQRVPLLVRPSKAQRHSPSATLIGLALCGLALLMLSAGSSHGGATLWNGRYDLLLLPIFAAGLVCVIFGFRGAWHLRLPILVCVLAWPPLWRGLITTFEVWSLNATIGVARVLGSAAHVAHYVRGSDGQFVLGQGRGAFTLIIGSACAGASSVVGWLVVGGAMAAFMSGATAHKAAWLGTGMAIAFVVNLARIGVLFTAGGLFGQSVTLAVLHPVAGYVAIALVVVIAMILRKRFGLEKWSMIAADKSHPIPPDPFINGSALRESLPPSAWAVRVMIGVLIVVAAFAGAEVDRSLGRMVRITNGIGEATVDPMGTGAPTLTGYTMEQLDDVAFSTQFFGSDSFWARFDYRASGPGATLQRAQLDVVSTSNAESFQQYGIAACYNFHGFPLLAQHTESLTAGITAHLVSYRRAPTTNWTAVWWLWRIGNSLHPRYERVVVMAQSITNVRSLDPVTLRSDPTVHREIAEQQRQLIDFSNAILARHLVTSS